MVIDEFLLWSLVVIDARPIANPPTSYAATLSGFLSLSKNPLYI
jgi:hypothetical protein